MQKKVIALAVAGLVSGAAFAQSNVTIYGVADLGFVSSSGTRSGANGANANTGSANYNGIDSGIWGGSRIGFKGEEGLGNGLKAIFTLEYYIAPDENTGVGVNPETSGAGGSGSLSRQTFVGLQHAKLGTLTLGRQYSAGFNAAARNDVFGAAATGATAVAQAAGVASIIAGNSGRLSNSIAYTSPNLSGFTVSGGYSFGEVGLSQSDGLSSGTNGIVSAGLNYANGPLNLDLAYHSRQDRSVAVLTAGAGATVGQASSVGSQASGDSVNEWMLGGSYDFKVVKLFATYQDLDDNNKGTTAATANSRVEASNRVWSVGASMPVFGNGKILASYADVKWDRTGAGSSDVWALGYTHNLSKRTMLYTTYTYADNDRNALNAAGAVGNTKFLGESNSTFAAGINHSF